MTRNTSSAKPCSGFMAARHEPRDSLDDFPTPPWATRALCGFLKDRGLIQPLHGVREPAANRGHMVRPLTEYFDQVEASDVHDYGAGFAVADYLFGPEPARMSWTITNPPFRLTEAFIDRMRATSSVGCAVLVRSSFLEGIGRHARLFSPTPPRWILQFTERVVMHRGRLAPEGSTATAYCWLVWLAHATGAPEFDWIPPCRKALERPGDYPAETREGAPCVTAETLI